jgi:polyisoprenoid-binding protein YceI
MTQNRQNAYARRTILAGGLAALAMPVGATPRAYQLVAETSRIAFIFYTGGTRQVGTLPVQTADIVVDPRALTRSRAAVTADIRRVSTGLVFMTEAIKSPGLLHADAHPIVAFQSGRIRLGAGGRISEGAEIDGDLQLRGVTRPITLQAELTRPAGTAPDDLSRLFIRLNGSLSRSAYGATGFSDLADDRVDLDIRAEIAATA